MKITEIGPNLKTIRKSKGYSQLALAIRANITPETISHVEHGDGVTVGTIDAICRALNLRLVCQLLEKTAHAHTPRTK